MPPVPTPVYSVTRMRRLALPLLAAALVFFVPAIAGADDGTISSYEQRGYFWKFLAAYGFGFLTSLTQSD